MSGARIADGPSRLLPAPALGGAVRTLGAPDPLLDPAVQARLAQEVAAARALGRREGAADAAAAADQAAGRVLAALVRVDAGLRALAAEADVALALAIARAVLGREPADAGTALLARVQEALAGLDDEVVAVHLHPDDAAILHEPLERAAVVGGCAVEVVEDRTIPAGEALLAGRWGRADLTRAGAWDAVQALLEEADGA